METTPIVTDKVAPRTPAPSNMNGVTTKTATTMSNTTASKHKTNTPTNNVIAIGCPECHQPFVGRSPPERLPARACKDCGYLICVGCWTARQELQLGCEDLGCPGCERQPNQRQGGPVIPHVTQRLLQQVETLQEQLVVAQDQATKAAAAAAAASKATELDMLAFRRNPALHNRTSKLKEGRKKVLEVYPKGTEVYKEHISTSNNNNSVQLPGMFGHTEECSFETLEFSIRYGDGDPEWVSQTEMEQLVRQAQDQHAQEQAYQLILNEKSKDAHSQTTNTYNSTSIGGSLNQNTITQTTLAAAAAASKAAVAAQAGHGVRKTSSLSPPRQHHSSLLDTPESFVGQSTYKEFPGIGWYWGVVRAYRVQRWYSVVWDDGQVGRRWQRHIPASHIMKWVEAAKRQRLLHPRKQAPVVLNGTSSSTTTTTTTQNISSNQKTLSDTCATPGNGKNRSKIMHEENNNNNSGKRNASDDAAAAVAAAAAQMEAAIHIQEFASTAAASTAAAATPVTPNMLAAAAALTSQQQQYPPVFTSTPTRLALSNKPTPQQPSYVSTPQHQSYQPPPQYPQNTPVQLSTPPPSPSSKQSQQQYVYDPGQQQQKQQHEDPQQHFNAIYQQQQQQSHPPGSPLTGIKRRRRRQSSSEHTFSSHASQQENTTGRGVSTSPICLVDDSSSSSSCSHSSSSSSSGTSSTEVEDNDHNHIDDDEDDDAEAGDDDTCLSFRSRRSQANSDIEMEPSGAGDDDDDDDEKEQKDGNDNDTVSAVIHKSKNAQYHVHRRQLPSSKRKFDAIVLEDGDNNKDAGTITDAVSQNMAEHVDNYEDDDDDATIESTRQVGMQVIGEKLSIPVESQGTGWKGFDLHITNDKLPCKLIEIVELLGFLFPVAAGEQSFLTCLWEKCAEKKNVKYGQELRSALRLIKLKDPNIKGLLWHRKNYPYVPPSKQSLADFVEILLNLDFAPKLLFPADTKQILMEEQLEQRSPEKSEAAAASPVSTNDDSDNATPVPVFDDLELPLKARGSGWEGFEAYITDECLPKNLRDVFLVLDFFFPTKAGDDTFVYHYFDKSGESPHGAPGGSIRSRLFYMKKKGPVEGMEWHKPSTPIVPPTKKDLASFMRLILRLSTKKHQKLSNGKEHSARKNGRKLPMAKRKAYFEGETTQIIKNAKSNDAMALSSKDRGSGWDGFHKHVSDNCLPKKCRDIFLLIDILFPVAPGAEKFVHCFFDKSGDENNIHSSLSRLKNENSPELEAMKWHEPGKPLVPKTKKDLEAFVNLILRLPECPLLLQPSQFFAKEKEIASGDGNDVSSPDFTKEMEQLCIKCGLPMDAQGTGWDGFNTYVTSDENLPRKFGQVFVLMDFFFPLGDGEDTYFFHFYEKTGKQYGKAGHQIHKRLSLLQKEDPVPEGLRWHKPHQPLVPQSKEDLASFVKLLMALKKAPPKRRGRRPKRPPTHSQEVLQSSGNQDDGDEEDEGIADPTSDMRRVLYYLGLPEDGACGAGWAGFAKYMGKKLPTSFRDVFVLIDIFFPIVPGEASFAARHFDASSKSAGEASGSEIRQLLRELKEREPNVKGLEWHRPGRPYVPQTKDDLVSFMELLMKLGQIETKKRTLVPQFRTIPPEFVPPAKKSRGMPEIKSAEIVRVDEHQDEEDLDDEFLRPPSPTHSICSTRSLVQIGGPFGLPNKALGSGWPGFEAYLSEKKLPKTLPTILKTMDYLFAFDEDRVDPFEQRLMSRGKGLHRELASLLKVLPNHPGLKWRGQKGSWSPGTKEDLREFVKLLWQLYKNEAIQE